MATIAVIDYGMGNLLSVSKALETVAKSQKVVVTNDPDIILDADRVVLPGVGAINDCIAELQQSGLEAIFRQAADSRPTLGICLGMQGLLTDSEENNGCQCLDIIPGHVVRFPSPHTAPGSGVKLKVPHMGWNEVKQVQTHPLWEGIADETRFYFVHSYYARPDNSQNIFGSCHYGLNFAAAIGQENLFATQFHPEKSQDAGLKLLTNFVHWDGKL